MAIIQDATNGATAFVEAGIGAQRVSIAPRGFGYAVAATTGTIAAALAANSTVFAMRFDTGASPRRAFIERVRLQYTTLVAYTTPITAGRRLGLFRASGGTAISGGTQLTPPASKAPTGDTSEFSATNGGDIRIATTGALTVTGFTFDTVPVREISLAHAGSAGSFIDAVWDFSGVENQPFQVDPGQVIAIRNPQAMDAAGTWALTVQVDWHEATAMPYSLS